MNQRETIINLAQKGWSEDQIEQELKINLACMHTLKKQYTYGLPLRN